MTFKELNLAIFERKTNKVLWQPRLEEWIFRNRANNALPDRFKDMEHLEIYDYLRCSVRYAASTGIDIKINEKADITFKDKREGDIYYQYTTTPVGTLTTVSHLVLDGDGNIVNQRIAEFPVKTPQDLKAVTYLVNNTDVYSNVDMFNEYAQKMGDRGEPSIILSSAGFTELIKHYGGLLDSIYLTMDYPEAVEEYLEACDNRDDKMVNAALELPCRIFNLGDHATDEFTPPPLLKKYMLPRWQKISKKFHENNRFVHSHWDGNSKTILPYLKESGLDSVEALTMAPMGNITLEEVKAAVGEELVCLDLIPAIYFLPNFKTSDLIDYTKRVIDMFAPRLILGVSDEISSVGEIEKIEAVTELVEDYNSKI